MELLVEKREISYKHMRCLATTILVVSLTFTGSILEPPAY
jgi:hypothetical protein